jgi:RNA polymerase sigma-70 factor, ECF subfamily
MVWPRKKSRVDELVEAHYRCLYAFAYRLSGSVQEAEDLTQEAFCQAQTKLDQLREWDRARSWLFTILRNIYLHRVRASKQSHQLPMDEVGDVPDRLPDPLPAVDGEKLQEALNELPEGWRTPLILFYFEEFSYREIADQMNVPLGTVMSRLARAKAFLRSRLLPVSGLSGPTYPAVLAFVHDPREGK